MSVGMFAIEVDRSFDQDKSLFNVFGIEPLIPNDIKVKKDLMLIAQFKAEFNKHIPTSTVHKVVM